MGLIAWVSWIVGETLVAPANRPVSLPAGGIQVVSATLQSGSGSSLAAWHMPHKRAHATVLLLHPLRATRASMLGRAKVFREAGYSVVMIDHQAHGESPGERITMGYLERHDVVAAVEFARTQAPHHRLAVVGWSLGGAAALLASPLDIDALVLEAVYPTIDEAVTNRLEIRLGSLGATAASPLLLCQLKPRLGVGRSELRPIERIAQVGCPIMVMGGDQDRHTTIAETRRLFRSAAEPKELVVFAGADHCDLLAFQPEVYQERVLRFLAKHLRE